MRTCGRQRLLPASRRSSTSGPRLLTTMESYVSDGVCVRSVNRSRRSYTSA